MRSENRDMKILRFINEFGFCELPQIQKNFNLSKHRAYKIMQRMIQRELVMHERIFFHRHGIYRATSLGAQITDLPKIDKIPVGIYEHQLAVIELYIKLKRKHPDATWMTERVLRNKGYMPSRNREKHYADALMFMSDGRQIAIEVELTMKSKRRLEQISKAYMSLFEIHEVWYFCPPDVYQKISKFMEKRSKIIKVFEWSPDITDKKTSVGFVG